MSRLSSGLFFIIAIMLSCLLSAAENGTKIIQVKMGDYRFIPSEIQLEAGQPVVLRLMNTDAITPHNFTLKDNETGLDVDIDVSAAETIDVHLMPLWPGRHTFYCSNKLLFMESHREKGMEGTLVVVPE